MQSRPAKLGALHVPAAQFPPSWVLTLCKSTFPNHALAATLHIGSHGWRPHRFDGYVLLSLR